MIGGIRFEHSHRMIAATVGFLTFGLTVWILREEKRHFMKVLAACASFAVLLQAILGGLTVKYLLPKPISIGHACLGQTFFCLVCALVLFLSKEWLSPVKISSKTAFHFTRLSWTTFGFAYCQLVAGAIVRHTHGQLLVAHIFIALLILIHAVFLNIKLFSDNSIQKKFLPQLLAIDGLLFLQLFLGLGAYTFKYALEKQALPTVLEVLFTTAHQTTGALILANLLVLSLRATKLLQSENSKSSSEYLDLIKPRVTLTALWTACCGYILASPQPFNATKFLHMLLGAFLVGAGGNALNQFHEREIDQKMTRTQERPLPSRKMEPENALIFGWLLSLSGIVEIGVFVSIYAAFIALGIFLSYVYIYTPLKKVTALNTYVGAVPGALPVLLGWVGAAGSIDAKAISLFMLLFIWQLPHFFAIAWVYREDYKKGGLQMLSRDDKSGQKTSFQILFFSFLLLLASLLPFHLELAGSLYLFAALAGGGILVVMAYNLRKIKLVHASRFVGASIIYILVIFTLLIVDKK